MNEQQPDAQPQAPPAEAQRDPVVFAPRIAPALREQVEGVRKLTGQTINDLGTEALTDWVAKKLGDEDLRKKAMAEIDAEEQRLRERRNSIASILGTTPVAATTSGDATPEAGTTTKGSRRPRASE